MRERTVAVLRGSDEREPLVRGLHLPAAASVVVGIMIGSGIFIGANRVAQGVESIWMIFAVWIGAGLLTLLGALTYAEMGAAFPRSGGDYVFIRRAISPFWGFLTGWVGFWVNLPFSVAALAVAFSSQLETLKPGGHGVLFFDSFAVRLTAAGVVLVFTFVNYLGVRHGGNAQTGLTFLKLGLIAIVVVIGLSMLGSNADNLSPFFGRSYAPDGGIVTGLALALVGALWAYDGWSNVTRVAAEVKNPTRNIPLSLTFGVLTVIVVYVLVTLAYLVVLGHEGMAGATGVDQQDRLVASRAASSLYGDVGLRFVAIVIMVSVLGSLNGLSLSGPRVFYAMARDRFFPAAFARVHPTRRTPHVSIIVQGVYAAVLALILSFEILTAFVVLAAWFQYVLVAIGLFLLRRREPHLPRPYKVPLYPFVPALFLVLSGAFVIYLVVDIIVRAFQNEPLPFFMLIINLFVFALAVPIYRMFIRDKARPQWPNEAGDAGSR